VSIKISHLDTIFLGELQLLLIGKFRDRDQDTYDVVKRTCDESNVRLFRSSEMYRLLDEIQREGKDLIGADRTALMDCRLRQSHSAFHCPKASGLRAGGYHGGFSFTGKQGLGFIHIATYANHVNIGFDRGTELEDPDELLRGTGKLIRHIPAMTENSGYHSPSIRSEVCISGILPSLNR